MATQIKIKNTHDRMSFKAIFDNGDDFTFVITRTRDRFEVGQGKGVMPIPRADLEGICKWLGWREGNENHFDRQTRFKALCEKANSLEGLALLASLEI